MKKFLLFVEVLTAIGYIALIVALIAAGLGCAKPPYCYDLPVARAGQDTLSRLCST